MVRRTRIVIAAVIAAGVLAGAALAPAAGDRHTSGASPRVTYTEDGVPVVDSGHKCKAGQGWARKHHRSYSADPSDY